MSEKMMHCPRCDRRTLHSCWKEEPTGGKANAAERLFLGLMTAGISELVMPSWRKCLRCGYKRRP